MTTLTKARAKLRRYFSAIPQTVREWTSYLQALFFSRTFTATLTGCNAVVTVEITYTVSAGVVVLHIPAVFGTSNSVGCVLDGLPDELVSTRSHWILARITDNGTTALGVAIIPEGVNAISLGVGLSGGAFTASGSKGLPITTLVYALD